MERVAVRVRTGEPAGRGTAQPARPAGDRAARTADAGGVHGPAAEAAPVPAAVPRDTGAPPAVTGRRRTGRAGGTRFRVFSHGFLVLWGVMAAGPLLWAVLTSLKPSADILQSPWSLPRSPRWQNFADAWTTADLGRDFLNTLLVVGCALAGSMVLAALAAYVLARFDFPGNRFVLLLFMSGMSAPVVLALVPLFFVLRDVALLDTLPGLILVYTAYSLPFSVFFLTSFFRTLPASVAEAALIDGASHLRILFHVMVPMARPGLVGIAMFDFLGMWNQYLIPQMINPDPDHYVLAQGLAALAVHQGYKGDWGALFAGLTLATLPLLAFYLLFRKQVQTGLATGAARQ